ncbi:hypothetical protein AB0M42_29260 [Streptomyces sp. NPDC051784]|uniref:hypothetical protein n=1 Tax=Streptomyces sp. NPDC051784 TaxID=3155805 RepID=UPI0034271DAD
MISKIRVLLGMFVLLALALGAIALLASLEASPVFFTFVPLGILVVGASVAQSLGWFNKKAG